MTERHILRYYERSDIMKKFRTVTAIIIMVISAFAGFIVGAFLNDPMGGAILFAIIAGFACMIYATDNRNDD